MKKMKNIYYFCNYNYNSISMLSYFQYAVYIKSTTFPPLRILLHVLQTFLIGSQSLSCV